MNNKGWEAESDNRGIKRWQGPWGIAGSSLAILLMVSFAAGNGWARDQITGDASEKLRLTVRVYILTPIPQHDLAMAERVASKIFQNVGVELSWVDCPLTAPAAQLNPACTTPHTPTDIHLNVVPSRGLGGRVRHGHVSGNSSTRPWTVCVYFLCAGEQSALRGTPVDAWTTTRTRHCARDRPFAVGHEQSLPLGPDVCSLECSGPEAPSAWTTQLLKRPGSGHPRRRSSTSRPAGSGGIRTGGFSEVT